VFWVAKIASTVGDVQASKWSDVFSRDLPFNLTHKENQKFKTIKNKKQIDATTLLYISFNFLFLLSK
jgi:hypothetical protein